MAFGNAFQFGAFQQDAFQIRPGADARYVDYGFYGTQEDDQLKRLLQQIAEERRKLKEWQAEERARLRAEVRDAYHYVPPGPPPPPEKLARPPFLAPPAGPINPWGLAQRLARAPLPPQAPQVEAPPPPDPMEEAMRQAMAQVDAIDVDGVLGAAMARIEAVDFDALLAGNPEYQRAIQMLERL